MAGDYRIELTPSEGANEELADGRGARPSARHWKSNVRNVNDALLLELTKQTGGEYFLGFGAAMNRGGANPSDTRFRDRPNDQVILPARVGG